MITQLKDGGRLTYLPSFLSEEMANDLYRRLRDGIAWEQLRFMGKPQKLRTKWIGEFAYTYSGHTRPSSPWTDETTLLRTLAERQVFGEARGQYKGVLLNYYIDGGVGLGPHADDEPEILPDSPIASVSLGATRRFDLKHNESGERVSLLLTNGSLLVMEGTTQRYWEHSVPPQRGVKGGRINLTFRRYSVS